jgi:hypothetical protein
MKLIGWLFVQQCCISVSHEITDLEVTVVFEIHENPSAECFTSRDSARVQVVRHLLFNNLSELGFCVESFWPGTSVMRYRGQE